MPMPSTASTANAMLPQIVALRRSAAAARGDSAGDGCRPASPRYLPPSDVLNDAEHHADARRGEAEMPVDRLPQVAAHQRREERAEVDPHVEDREPRVAALVLGRVELPDDDADVALEQPGAEHDQEQPQIEGRGDGEGHAEVADGDQDPAVEHGAPLPDEPIGDPAAGQAGHIDHRGVKAVDRAAAGRVEAQAARRQRAPS